MNIYILAIACLSLASCGKSSGQTPVKNIIPIRPAIMRLARNIADDNMLKSAGVGEAGIRTAQWERYELLRRDATNEELTLLTNDKNSVVRCYSFQALASRKINVFPIVFQHLADTASVKTFTGCIISSSKSGDYFIDVVTPDYVDLSCYKLNNQQQAILDSVLINDSNVKVDRKANLLATIKPNNKYYQQIRLEAESGSPQATLALARFQKQSDIGIISKLFSGGEDNIYYGIYSAKEFPSPEFYPYLIKEFEKEWQKKLYDYSKWRLLYQALTKYPNSTTYNLFERTAQTKDEFRKQTLGGYLFLAIHKYPNPIFTPFLSLIKLDDFHSNEMKREEDIEN